MILENIMADNNKNKLISRIWRTKGSRFNAYRRLATKNKVLTFVTSFSSIHLLAIGILQLTSLITLTKEQSQLLSFISIILSIIILAYSLIENGKEHGLKSERHHLCGIDLDRIYTRLELVDGNDTENIAKLADNYNLVTKKYLHNHETIDDEYFQLQHPTDFTVMASKYWFSKLKIRFFYGYYDAMKALVFSFVPLIISIKIIL
jgi:hypothetical protein